MLLTGKPRIVRLVFFLTAVLVSGSVAAISATTASAEASGSTGLAGEALAPVQEVTETVTPPVGEVPPANPAPVEEAVTPPVEGVKETAAPPAHEATKPVQEASEAVSPPVKGDAENVTRPAKEAVEAVKPPSHQVTGTVAPGVHPPTDTSGSPDGNAAKGSGTVAREAPGTATHIVKGAVGSLTDPTPADPSSTGAGRNAAGADRGAPAATAAPRGAAGPSAAAATPDPGPVDDTFEVLSHDGSIRAPLAKWVAYVWPAIALTGPGLSNLLGNWEQQSLRLAFGTVGGTGTVGTTGSGDGPVVAGVHAAGGRPEASDSSHSLFSKVPGAIGHAFSSSVPTSLLAYLFVVAIVLVAVLAAVRLEILAGRRRRREG